MRSYHQDLGLPGADGTSPEWACDLITQKVLQVSAVFTANLQVEATVDGTNWVDVGGVIAAPALLQIPDWYASIRVEVSGWVAGTPVAVLGGLDNTEH